jgi:seryl-tRNA synthetase
LKKLSNFIADVISNKDTGIEKQMKDLETKRNATLCLIGNIVHESCVVSNDEENNGLVRTWGELKTKKECPLNHVDCMKMLGVMDTEQGPQVAGERAYYLMGDIVRMNLALQMYGLDFLRKRGKQVEQIR